VLDRWRFGRESVRRWRETARAQNARELEAKLADRLRKGAATAVRANSKEKNGGEKR